MAKQIRAKGKEYLKIALEEKSPVIILCGRPYHLDPEINHGIDKLICDCGAVLITEDSVSDEVEAFSTTVLNQWTYHSRLYALQYVADSGNQISTWFSSSPLVVVWMPSPPTRSGRS